MWSEIPLVALVPVGLFGRVTLDGAAFAAAGDVAVLIAFLASVWLLVGTTAGCHGFGLVRGAATVVLALALGLAALLLAWLLYFLVNGG